MLIILLISVFLLSLYRVKVNLRGFNDDFLSKYKTDSIKGIFILLVVLSHSMQYITQSGYMYDGLGDSLFKWFLFTLSQLVVVMFLFYSGYGVGESVKKKGSVYVNNMPRHRIFTTFLNFDVAVLVFFITGFLIGKTYTTSNILLSFIGWTSVGNSNWYIFVILWCYLLTYLVLRLNIAKPALRLSFLFVLCIILCLCLAMLKEDYWYNTLFCFPLGFALSAYKDFIIGFLKKNYWKSLCCLFVAFVVLYECPVDRFGLTYNTMSLVFALLIMAVTMKVSIGNKELNWVGKNLFPIYIYMRLPMMIIEELKPEFVADYPFGFVVISFVVTIAIANVYPNWQIKL